MNFIDYMQRYHGKSTIRDVTYPDSFTPYKLTQLLLKEETDKRFKIITGESMYQNNNFYSFFRTLREEMNEKSSVLAVLIECFAEYQKNYINNNGDYFYPKPPKML